jgi:hypothetical protein
VGGIAGATSKTRDSIPPYRYFLSSFIKWMMVVVLIIAWLVVAVSSANFVRENYVSGAKTLVFLGARAQPIHRRCSVAKNQC